MGINRPKPKLEPGEEQQWIGTANQKRGLASSSGLLVVTDRRVRYEPSRIDRLTGHKRWECPLAEIIGIEDMDRDALDLFSGGMRRRLGIRTTDGVEVFVVSHLEETMAELTRFLPPATEP